MARIIIFLLCLLLRNNAYATWCSWGQNQTGYIENLYCTDQWAYGYVLQSIWCPSHTSDPSCAAYYQPVCTAQVEYRTLSCPIHQSGAINETRTYQCSSQSWGPWTTTSTNCTQDPPTCIESTETRQLTCQAGYEGLLQEQRSSLCSDPYGSPTWTAWSTLSNTCTMTATNINNPVSPISPISPTNPNSVISQQITTAPIVVPESVTVQDMTAIVTTPSTETVTTSVATVQSTSTTASTNTTSSIPSSNTTTTSATVKAPETPKGKEIVPGFGIVMSMQLINSGYNLQQQQIEESIKLIQEQDYERQQNILLEFISANDTGDYIIRASANRWRSILRDNPLQRFDLDD